MIRFMSIASGSTGNCYYLGTEKSGILIDVGTPMRNIRKALFEKGIDIATHIQAILLTHDHADHVRMVGKIANEYNFPIYALEEVIHAIDRSRFVERIQTADQIAITEEVPFEISGFQITPFRIPHDSIANVGYHIVAEDFTFTLMTDVGHITPQIEHYAHKAEHLVLEANYDSEMLAFGSYPIFLKERVSGPLGHLSNQESVEFLCRVYHPKMKNVWLCHLSKENNHPELCRKTFDIRLFNEGIRVGKDLYLEVLKRTSPSQMFVLQE